jgi:hypothetical protein
MQNITQPIEVGEESLRQISLENPLLGFLLFILVGAIVYFVIENRKLNKRLQSQAKEFNDKLDSKNDKLYEEAKADFQLVLAFEKKLDNCLTGGKLIAKDIMELKDKLNNIRVFMEQLKN